MNPVFKARTKALLMRSMVGPAMIVDGIIATATLGIVSGKATLCVTRSVAKARTVAMKAKHAADGKR
jgi:hypothetical protein